DRLAALAEAVRDRCAHDVFLHPRAEDREEAEVLERPRPPARIGLGERPCPRIGLRAGTRVGERREGAVAFEPPEERVCARLPDLPGRSAVREVAEVPTAREDADALADDLEPK